MVSMATNARNVESEISGRFPTFRNQAFLEETMVESSNGASLLCFGQPSY